MVATDRTFSRRTLTDGFGLVLEPKSDQPHNVILEIGATLVDLAKHSLITVKLLK